MALILVLLTQKWAPSIPYLRLPCIIGLLYPLHVIKLSILTGKGRSDIFLRLGIIKKILLVVTVAITYRWGILAMIYGQIVVSILGYYLNSYYTGKLISYPIREQVVDLLPYLGAAVAMGTGVFCLQLLPFPNDWSLLICQILFAMVIYTGLTWGFRMKAFLGIVDILRDKLRQRRPQLSFLK